MLFKVINKDKVKVLIEKNEFSKSFLDDIQNQTEEGKNALALLLINIYNETGISFLNSDVYIELVTGISNSFYIIITRLDAQSTNEQQLMQNESDMYIYRLNNIEDIFDIANKIDTNLLTSNSLYKYKNSYYLLVSFKKENIEKTLETFSRLAKKCKWRLINDAILNEWGTLIKKDILNKIKSVC